MLVFFINEYILYEEDQFFINFLLKSYEKYVKHEKNELFPIKFAHFIKCNVRKNLKNKKIEKEIFKQKKK